MRDEVITMRQIYADTVIVPGDSHQPMDNQLILAYLLISFCCVVWVCR